MVAATTDTPAKTAAEKVRLSGSWWVTSPFWWSNLLSSQKRPVAVILCLTPGILVYAAGILCTWLAGNVEAGFTDRWVLLYTFYTLIGSIALAYIPRIALRVAPRVSPWIFDSAEGNAGDPISLSKFTRPFWYGVAIAIITSAPFVVGAASEQQISTYTDLRPIRVFAALMITVRLT